MDGPCCLHQGRCAGAGALFSIREIIQTTDAWTNLQNRLRLVTSTRLNWRR
ncbi:hypothetical protein [Pseudomonas aeruginosa]|uniref:hypothetical protein n=1 Tax=Pseudomonas aeruginosa TaxID=287 RepID=UPI001ADAB450|nr:hypothetical protein [Pseudomonas aeruginosa]MBO8298674.1 hypothetical protein [Pseudomonas aeruginosa]